MELSVSRLSILHITALVTSTIWPLHVTDAIHLVVLPLSLIHPAVNKGVRALTVHRVVHKLPSERGPIYGCEEPVAVFLAVAVFAPELGAVHPSLVAKTEFHILLPVTFIRRSIGMQELAVSVSLVVQPLSLVDVAIGMRELTFATSPVIPELTLISATVWLGDDTMAMPAITKPLSHVDRATFYFYLRSLNGLASSIFPLGVVGHLEPYRLWSGRHFLIVILLRQAACPTLQPRHLRAAEGHRR
mmetsp:Transcript_26210/g.68952  ORF Transcript_26210/g.68952 Transcript_26210/m.68952 type:complete len:245 (+) Transcript_26210:669-1403(+)